MYNNKMYFIQPDQFVKKITVPNQQIYWIQTRFEHSFNKNSKMLGILLHFLFWIFSSDFAQLNRRFYPQFGLFLFLIVYFQFLQDFVKHSCNLLNFCSVIFFKISRILSLIQILRSSDFNSFYASFFTAEIVWILVFF